MRELNPNLQADHLQKTNPTGETNKEAVNYITWKLRNVK